MALNLFGRKPGLRRRHRGPDDHRDLRAATGGGQDPSPQPPRRPPRHARRTPSSPARRSAPDCSPIRRGMRACPRSNSARRANCRCMPGQMDGAAASPPRRARAVADLEQIRARFAGLLQTLEPGRQLRRGHPVARPAGMQTLLQELDASGRTPAGGPPGRPGRARSPAPALPCARSMPPAAPSSTQPTSSVAAWRR